jgi:single-stranded-DNA-specific exonuclease
MSKRWKVLGNYSGNIDSLLPYLLKTRGFINEVDIEEFLNPSDIKHYYSKFPDDFKNSLKAAKDLINDSVSKNIPIVIYGDYDSDGVNATAIIYSTIKNELNYTNVTYFIPNRFTHGYGVSREAIDEIVSKFKNGEKILFITVDTGITATKEIEYLKSLGHLVILTDHHQKPDNVPQPDVLVWNEEIVGSMVSWFLSKALGSKNNQSLGFGAIATVTDLFPLVGVNRSIVKTGLKILNEATPLGIKKLLEVSGKKGEITTYDLGWVIGPRLNAAGRLDNASLALELLLEQEEDKSFQIATDLNAINLQRQDKTLQMYELMPIDEKNLPKIILVANEEYHDGIIGLVASRLVQKYYRPSIVISLEDGFGKGSVRSIDGVNIIEMLRKFDELFTELGGHPMAAGFSIKKENIAILQEKLLEVANTEIPEELLTPVLKIDLEIPVNLINVALLDKVDMLKPFGLGNEQPVFVSRNLSIVDVSKVGRDNTHLVLKLSDGVGTYKSIWFGGVGLAPELCLGDKVDVVYTLNRNDYNGRTYVDLVLKDLKKL